ncbi:M14 family zinc carboxypeptidase [Streptomyces sp. JNUCC 64]
MDGTTRDIRAAVARIGDVDRYPAVDEAQDELDRLAEAHPRLVTVRRVGTSRQGEPIRMASIGSGARDALVFGGPHPDEPVGALTVRELGRILCADPDLRERLGLRWHLIPCVDPDGARLNEGWYARPGTREGYARGSYRPAFAEQVEWTFPRLTEPGYFDRVPPETQALARVIDELAPALLCSLHNAEYGGVFHYVTAADTGLAERLAAIPAWEGLTSHRAVFEVPDSDVVAPGVLLLPTPEDLLAESGGGERAFGAGSAEYARRHGTLSVVTEVPYWDDPSTADTTPSGRAYRQVVADSVKVLEESSRQAAELVDRARPDLRLDTPFLRSCDDTVRSGAASAAGWRRVAADPATERRTATVAEGTAFRALPHLFRLRCAGAARRLFDAELAAGNTRRAVRRGHGDAERLLARWLADADADLPGRFIPLRRITAVQVASVLTAAHHLREHPTASAAERPADGERG